MFRTLVARNIPTALIVAVLFTLTACGGGGGGSSSSATSSTLATATYVAGPYPHSIAIDGSGNAWVTNSGNGNVTELSPAGTVLGTFVAGSSPFGIAIDGSGNAWVANQGNGTAATGVGDSNVTEFMNSGATGVPTPLFFNPNNQTLQGSVWAWLAEAPTAGAQTIVTGCRRGDFGPYISRSVAGSV